MSASTPKNPAQVVIGSCADAIANTGIMAEHVRQMGLLQESDPDAAALHKRAAVQHAHGIRKLLAAAFEQIEGFIEAVEEKPRIVRPGL